jgi:hypothetical protein
MDNLFVVERYDDTGTPGRQLPVPTPPAQVRVVCAVRVPVDDVVIAVVEGTDEPAVCAALSSVGWRVDRITAATRVHLGEDGNS